MFPCFSSSLLFACFLSCSVWGFLIPPPGQPALMARYVAHLSDWVSIATLSTEKVIKGYPFVNLKSMSDGPTSNGTGIPYLYMSDLDQTGQDIKVDNRCSIMITLAQSDYCKSQDYDPQDPRCVRVLMSGTLSKLENNTAEYNFAKNALYSRHPAMKNWPKNHNFYIAKMNLYEISVLDFFGGIKSVNVEDYFKASPNSKNIINIEFDDVLVIQVDA